MNTGGTLLEQHRRTVIMLESMVKEQPLHLVLWFLYDCQTTMPDLKTLAQIAQIRSLE